MHESLKNIMVNGTRLSAAFGTINRNLSRQIVGSDKRF